MNLHSNHFCNWYLSAGPGHVSSGPRVWSLAQELMFDQFWWRKLQTKPGKMANKPQKTRWWSYEARHANSDSRILWWLRRCLLYWPLLSCSLCLLFMFTFVLIMSSAHSKEWPLARYESSQALKHSGILSSRGHAQIVLSYSSIHSFKIHPFKELVSLAVF